MNHIPHGNCLAEATPLKTHDTRQKETLKIPSKKEHSPLPKSLELIPKQENPGTATELLDLWYVVPINNFFSGLSSCFLLTQT